jgi:cephalosporin-C deacetylase-like acetyl esterase
MRKFYILVFVLFWIGTAGADSNEDFAKLAGMFNYDSSKPLDIQESSVLERDGATLHDISFASAVQGRINAFLIVPKSQGPHAGILFGHWGLGTRSEFIPEALLYAKAGAVSLLIDYPWERTGTSRRKVDNIDKPEKDREAYVQAVIDAMRGIDLLAARKDVDPNRIGYVGHSYGAQWGAILSSIDKRLKTAVLMGGAGAQKDMLVDNNDPDIVEFRNGLPKGQLDAYIKVVSQLDAILYVSHSMIPVLFQFANYERYFDKSSMERYYKTAANPKNVEWYDTGHDLNDVSAFRSRAFWLSKYLVISKIQLCN